MRFIPARSKVRIFPPLPIKFHIWLRGQVVKTPPFHGGIMGSSPVGVTNKNTFGCFFVAPTRLLSHSLASLVGLSPCKPCRALTNALRALVPSLRVFMSSFFIHLSYFLRLDRETSFAYVTKKSTSNGGFFLTRLVVSQLTRFARGFEPMETLSSLGKYTACACLFSPRYHGKYKF